MTDTTNTLWMTQAALDHLTQELDELTRTGIDSDETTQARILQLRDLIRRAEVGQKPDDGVVEAGMQVTIRFESDGSEEKFLLGDRELVGALGLDLDVYSPDSPLGLAVSGRVVGDRVDYRAPSGAAIAVTIVAAVPFA